MGNVNDDVQTLELLHDRPHDRVSLKEMKADWQSCLDNKVGFKVRPIFYKCFDAKITIMCPKWNSLVVLTRYVA